MGFEYRIESKKPEDLWQRLLDLLISREGQGFFSDGHIRVKKNSDIHNTNFDIQISKIDSEIWIIFIATNQETSNTLCSAIDIAISEGLISKVVDDDGDDQTKHFLPSINK